MTIEHIAGVLRDDGAQYCIRCCAQLPAVGIMPGDTLYAFDGVRSREQRPCDPIPDDYVSGNGDRPDEEAACSQ